MAKSQGSFVRTCFATHDHSPRFLPCVHGGKSLILSSPNYNGRGNDEDKSEKVTNSAQWLGIGNAASPTTPIYRPTRRAAVIVAGRQVIGQNTHATTHVSQSKSRRVKRRGMVTCQQPAIAFGRGHLAGNVISVGWPPCNSMVTGLVPWLAREGFGCPCTTYRPGGTSANEI